MEARMNTAQTTIGTVAFVLMLAVSAETANAQVCGNLNSAPYGRTVWNANLARPALSQQNWIGNDLQFPAFSPRRTHAYTTTPGFFGFWHYGPAPGLYANHYGYYSRPKVVLKPRFGWLRYRPHRPH